MGTSPSDFLSGSDLSKSTLLASLEGDAATTRLTEILDLAAVLRTKLAMGEPAQPAQKLMILLHTGPFLIKRGEISTADGLREFAGPTLDRIQITKQKQRK